MRHHSSSLLGLSAATKQQQRGSGSDCAYGRRFCPSMILRSIGQRRFAVRCHAPPAADRLHLRNTLKRNQVELANDVRLPGFSPFLRKGVKTAKGGTPANLISAVSARRQIRLSAFCLSVLSRRDPLATCCSKLATLVDVESAQRDAKGEGPAGRWSTGSVGNPPLPQPAHITGRVQNHVGAICNQICCTGGRPKGAYLALIREELR